MNDWRKYDFDRVRHEQFDLPIQVKEKLLFFMKACKIHFGAIDMILTPAGEYYFLEVNPSGQYGWIESLTAMPISRAIAETLTNPSRE
jgi:glutathione synthase/RimK-type ligase-like ATP-grasp enzyme